MTQDEIIEMGIKADLCDKFGDINFEYGYLNEIVAFANLVSQHEREACAKVCETLWNTPTNGMATEEQFYGEQCAKVIRARGQA
jgi:hypothetical protein